MNRIEITAQGVPFPSWSERAAVFVTKVLDFLQRDGWDISVLVCDEETIRELNKNYRKKDEATDILSFGMGEKYFDEEEGERYLAGDIALCLKTCAENADYFNVGRDEELRRLLIHGILHLDGLDHETNNAGEEMLKFQEEILVKFGREYILL